MRARDRVTASQLCRISGASYRQIDHWTRLGILKPAVAAQGPGTRRQYDFTETVIAAAIADWSRATRGQVSLRAAREIRAAVEAGDPYVELTVSPHAYMVFDLRAVRHAAETALEALVA